MGTYPPPGRGFSQHLEELFQQLDVEVRNAVTYVNDSIVPQVRRDSISAMRTLSEKLRTLADHLDGQVPPNSPRDSRP